MAVELIRSSDGASFESSSKVSPALLITFTISCKVTITAHKLKLSFKCKPCCLINGAKMLDKRGKKTQI